MAYPVVFPSGFVWDSIPSVQEVPVSRAQGVRLSACATEEKPGVWAPGEFLTVVYFVHFIVTDFKHIVTMTKISIRYVQSSEKEVTLYSCSKTVSIS